MPDGNDLQPQDSPIQGQLTPPTDQPVPTNGLSPFALQAMQQYRQQQDAQANTPPSHVQLPALYELGRSLIHPPQPTNALLNRPSRSDALMDFVQHFLSSFASGMANAGTGPAANARGFGAAMQAPYQQQLQEYQIRQQQQQEESERQLRQSQAQLAQAQSSMIFVPGVGYLPAKEAAGVIGSQARAGATVQAAGIRAGATTQVAQINAASRESVARMNDSAKEDIAKGQVGIQMARIRMQTLQGDANTAYKKALINNLQVLARQRDQQLAIAQTNANANAIYKYHQAENAMKPWVQFVKQEIGLTDDDLSNFGITMGATAVPGGVPNGGAPPANATPPNNIPQTPSNGNPFRKGKA